MPVPSRTRAALALGAAATALTATAASTASAAAAKRDPCRDPAFRTVTANGTVRVVRGPRGTEEHTARLACFGHRRAVVLGDELSEESVGQVAVGGRFAAVALTSCSRYDGACESAVQVVDARAGRRSRKLYERGADAGLLVRPTGAVVGLAREADGTFTLWHGARGRHADLRTRAPIVPGSLALAGDRLYWLEGEEPRTALLSPPPPARR